MNEINNESIIDSLKTNDNTYDIKIFLESLNKVNKLSNEIKIFIKDIMNNLESPKELLFSSSKFNSMKSKSGMSEASFEDKMKRFIQEFCEESDNNYCLSYELLGAYRIWSKGLTAKDRSLFSKFVKKNYKSKRKYYKEHNESSLLTYIGIKPKDLNITRQDITRQDKNTLPKYEEFVLTECKYNYNYRIGYTNFIDEYKRWYLKKYPDYIFSKQEHFNMDTYLNRNFLKERINMPGYRNVLGIWGLQLKSENSITLGINPTHRKEIVKIDCKTRTIIEEYKSLAITSDILKLDQSTIINYIKNKQVINCTLSMTNPSVQQDSFILQYKKDTLYN